jgi:hypothetical protein
METECCGRKNTARENREIEKLKSNKFVGLLTEDKK